MINRSHLGSRFHTIGLTAPDTYTSAWVSLVPTKDLSEPAWPTALDYVRSQQLPDGGWGESSIYHAHDRVMSTLAALWALAEWRLDPRDEQRIARGVDALHRYAEDLRKEPYETGGFELILPRLVEAVKRLGISVPIESFAHVELDTTRKLTRVGKISFDDGQPKSWWLSAEGLSEERLASIEDTTNLHGGFGIAPSATAACLRALRRHGRDSQAAFNYINNLVDQQGGVCHLWPIDNFEIAWALDFYRRAQFDDPSNAALTLKLAEQWTLQHGLGSCSTFPEADGDTTAVGYAVLCSAGLKPDDEELMQFWRDGVFLTFPVEYKASASVQVHALTAFRQNGNSEHQKAAILAKEWLREQPLPLHDKWNISPFYATGRLIPALIGWDDEFAIQCVESLLEHQLADGGWGSRGASTAEETSYAVLGLAAAWQAKLLSDATPLKKAKSYLAGKPDPDENIWIGKVLYRPIGVVRSALIAARYALETIVTKEKVA